MLTKAFLGKWRLWTLVVSVFLVLSNPSPGDFELYLRNRLHDPLENQGFFSRLIEKFMGKYPMHRRNLLLFSIYDVNYQSGIAQDEGSQVVLGIGKLLIPLYQTPPGVTPFWQGHHIGYLRI